MPAGVNHYPDPGVSFGAFRVLPRTDGRWAVVDERRPVGNQTVMTFEGKTGRKQAEKAARTWFEQGHG